MAYNKQYFADGDVLMAEQLNQIENGVSKNATDVANMQEEMNDLDYELQAHIAECGGSTGGVSPTIKVTQTANGAIVEATDKDGTTIATIHNGERGEKGDNGYTPQKGIDYTDGKNGISVSILDVHESTEDGGINVVTFSDGKTLAVYNGSKGSSGTSVTVQKVSESTIDDGFSFVTFSDGKELKVKNGSKGSKGNDGTSVSVSNVSDSNIDGGSNVVTFSDGKTLTIKNGSKGSKGDKGENGTSVTVLSVNQADNDSGRNIVTFSDGKQLFVYNGSKGDRGTSIYYNNSIMAESNCTINSVNYQHEINSGDLFVSKNGALFKVSGINGTSVSLTYLTTLGGSGGSGGSIEVIAEIGQTIVVKEVDIDGIPTKWEAVERTHWKEERQDFVAFDGSVKLTSGMGSIAVGSNAIKIGEKYVVTWNGSEYTCVAKSAGGSVMLGNAGIWGEGESTGEPFVIEVITADYSTVGMSTSSSTTITLKIETRAEVVYHKLDPNYLPDGVPYIEYGEEVEILPECQPIYSEDVGGFIIEDVIAGIEVGKDYVVNWNGVDYTSKAIDGTEMGETGVYVLGDAYTITDGAVGTASTGEPFLMLIVQEEFVADYGMGAMIMPIDGTTELTISITQSGETIRKLDPKFLPYNLQQGGSSVMVVTFSGEAQGSEIRCFPDKSFEEVYEALANKKCVAGYFDVSTISPNVNQMVVLNVSRFEEDNINFCNFDYIDTSGINGYKILWEKGAENTVNGLTMKNFTMPI